MEVSVPDALTEYLFERRYEQVDPSGERRFILLQIGKPYLLDRSESIWGCRWSLLGLNEAQRIHTVQGRDALDALLCALKVAHVYLKSITETAQNQLYWQGNVPGTGLPTVDLLEAEPPLADDFSSVFEEVVEAFFRHYKHQDPPTNDPSR
jgi:hypothetical protein